MERRPAAPSPAGSSRPTLRRHKGALDRQGPVAPPHWCPADSGRSVGPPQSTVERVSQVPSATSIPVEGVALTVARRLWTQRNYPQHPSTRQPRSQAVRPSTFAVEHPDQRLSVSECVVDRVMIVFGPPQTLPLLCVAKVANQSSVEVADAAAGVPERVLAEIPPEVEVDPLEVVGRVVGR